jgi:catechol 2,3-dioxygenase-like lactoylglutathione lyase family enzyme
MGVRDGIRNIVIGCPRGTWRNGRVEGEPRQLGEFYAGLLGWRIIRDDWIKVGTGLEDFPHLAFGDGWTDRGLPVQGHVDVRVPAVAPAVEWAVGVGGSVIADHGDAHVVLADPFGHPVCVRDGDGAAAGIDRVVLDCPVGETGAMTAFYEGLLGPLNGLRFQELGGFVRTTWPDPAVPEQIHLDLHFVDRDAAVTRAEALGARRLPRPGTGGGGVVTFADPAGHPLCLCTSTGN